MREEINKSFCEYWKHSQNLRLDFYPISGYVILTAGQSISAKYHKCNVIFSNTSRTMSSHAFLIISSLNDARTVNEINNNISI